MGIAFGASALAFGVSFALGAFFAGVDRGPDRASAIAQRKIRCRCRTPSRSCSSSPSECSIQQVLIEHPMEVPTTDSDHHRRQFCDRRRDRAPPRYPVDMALVGAGLSQIGEILVHPGRAGRHRPGAASEEGRDYILAGSICRSFSTRWCFCVVSESLTRNGFMPGGLHDEYGKKRLAALGGNDRVKGISEAPPGGAVTGRSAPSAAEARQSGRAGGIAASVPALSALPGDRVIRAGERGDMCSLLRFRSRST